MLQLITFITSPIGRFAAGASAVVLLGLIAWGSLKIHDSNIKKAALEQFNKKQLELILESQKKIESQLKDIADISNKIQIEVNLKNDQLSVQIKSLEDYLNEPDTIKQDRGASPILKNTIKELQKGTTR